MVLSPFGQFEIYVLIPISWHLFNFSITNSVLFMTLVMGMINLFFYVVVYKTYLFGNGWQVVVENLYGFLYEIVREHLGIFTKQYFLFIFVLFVSLLGFNIVGMLPYSFTVTSHCSVTFTLSLSICIGIFLLGVLIHKSDFFNTFLPPGSPLALAPLLIIIEIISYLSHSVSLAIRLFANMMSGHALLKILAGFVWTMTSVGGILYVASLGPLFVIIALVGLEIGIACLQAYVFTVLTCIYLKDTLYLH